MSGQRKALIIANDEYEQEALANLLAPGADAEALGGVLGDAQIGDFSVQVVRNEPSYVIEAQIEDLFSESRSDDVLLLHFSGHGLKSESGELFFAASNTRPNRLGSTAVSADFVQRCMRDSRSRSVVLLLDCCYGGAFAQGVKVRAAGDVNVLDSFPQGRWGGRGRAVITASNAMEYAFEGDRLADDQHQRPSVFTSALVEGLATGDADRDEDGLVSLNELYDYVFDKVREQNPHQTPSRQVELEGELYLARTRRRRIRPAAIPPDLQAAITDPNMYTRRGAVHELQSRLASEDLPVAAGAYEALAGIARTDIQYVADLAAAALGQAAVRPEETELHFGEHRQGSDPPHRMVRLLGPPIARACAPRVSDEWIRVTETTEGFDISVDTTATGTLRGSIDLKGPTGEAAIAVDVELLPQAAQPQAGEQIPQRVDGDGDVPLAKRPLLAPGGVTSATQQPSEHTATEIRTGQPPQPRPGATPGSTPSGDGTAGQDAASAPARRRPGRRRRGVVLAATAATVAVVGGAIATVILLTGGSGRNPGSNANAGSTSQGTFTENGPWRLQVTNNIPGNDPNGANGCSITLTDAHSGTQILPPQTVYPTDPLKNVYGTATFQFHQAGSFRWQANDATCVVVPIAGPGAGKLPFTLITGGDSDAFPAPAQVAVQVTDNAGSPTCAVGLLDPANGQVVSYKIVTWGQNNDTVVLDPGGRRTVYLANSIASNCTVKVSAAP